MFTFPLKKWKTKKHKQLRCENTPLKKYRLTYTLGRPPPLIRFRKFVEYPLSPPPSERTYFLNGPKNLSIFSKHNIRLNLGKSKAYWFWPKQKTKKNHYSYKNSNVKKNSENKYVFRRKIFLHEKLSDQNFFKKDKFYQLVQADSLDFSGSNNPKGGNHESNRAKEERTSIKITGLYIWNLNCETTQNRVFFSM